MIKFFKAFNCPSEIYAGGLKRLLNVNCDCNCHTFVLPTFLFDAASRLCQTFHEESNKIVVQRRNLRTEAEQQLNEERNKIFNEGVAYGRNLLLQLNNGEISLKEFESDVKKY